MGLSHDGPIFFMHMKKLQRIHIGPRILKTAAAVILSLVLVDAYGTTSSKLIFAMLGAMAAMEPTFRSSWESCLTQIVGVVFGALVGIGLRALQVDHLLAAGLGIVIVITAYNALRIRFAPGLPCIIVLTLCTTEGIVPIEYAMGRIWDTAIGMAIGMLINVLVFPYDNRRQIRATAMSLERHIIAFLEELFDGDDILPDEQEMAKQLGILARQMEIFSDQRLFFQRKQQNRELENFRLCESKARELLARMTVLSHMGNPGRLTEENRRSLAAAGANIRDQRPLDATTERDVVTNYHVKQILRLRRELLDSLK